MPYPRLTRYHRPHPGAFAPTEAALPAVVPSGAGRAGARAGFAGRIAMPSPTRLRPYPLQCCTICGNPVPPWRDSCVWHDQRQGVGMPPVPILRRLDISELPTAEVRELLVGTGMR